MLNHKITLEAGDPRLYLALAPGYYVLAEDWRPTHADKRLTRQFGLTTLRGFPAGFRFQIAQDDEHKNILELRAPFSELATSTTLLRGSACSPDGEGPVWFLFETSDKKRTAALAADIVRLFEAMRPDDSLATWLDDALHNGAYQHGYGDEALLVLLTTGQITKDQIKRAVETVREQQEP